MVHGAATPQLETAQPLADPRKKDSRKAKKPEPCLWAFEFMRLGDCDHETIQKELI